MINNDIDIGKLIKKKRKEKRLTLEKVANKVGVGKSTVSKWERGAIVNMKKDKLDALSLILDIDPLVFVYGSEKVLSNTKEIEKVTPQEFRQEVISLLNKTTNLSEQQKQHLINTLDFICSDDE